MDSQGNTPVKQVQYKNNIYELVDTPNKSTNGGGDHSQPGDPTVNLSRSTDRDGVVSLPRKNLTPEELGALIDDPSILDHIHNLYVRRVARARTAMATLQETKSQHSSVAAQLADAEGEIARSKSEALAAVEQQHERLQAELDMRYRATVAAVEQEAAARTAPLAGLRAETEQNLAEVERVTVLLKGKFREESEAQFIQGFEPVMEDVSSVLARPAVQLPAAIAGGRAGDFAEAKAHKFCSLCFGHRKSSYARDIVAAATVSAAETAAAKRALKKELKRRELQELRELVERSQVERALSHGLNLDSDASGSERGHGGRGEGRVGGGGASWRGGGGGGRRPGGGGEGRGAAGSEASSDMAASMAAREIEALVEWTRQNPPPVMSSRTGGSSAPGAASGRPPSSG